MDIDGDDLDVTLHETEEEAVQALGDLISEIYADLRPPENSSEEAIDEWMGEQMIFDRWKIKRVMEN